MRKKKILFIVPALPELRITKDNPIEHKKLFTLPYLGILYLAALTPKKFDVDVINEHIRPIDYNQNVDLVGITVMTPMAPRAYEISKQFRRKGIKTILGGLHPTYMTAEALKNCDSVVKGEAEEIWPQILRDFDTGKLKKVYQQKRPSDLSMLPLPRRELLPSENNPYDVIQATRGCVFKCEFCSVHKFMGNKFRMRPIDSVIDEIRQLNGKFISFVDDNLMANKRWAKELFKSMIPLKKKWVSMATITIALDDELLALAKKSGCLGFFIGIETMDIVNLEQTRKLHNKCMDTATAIKKMQSYGLGISAGTVYGFDHDKNDVFEKTLDFVKKNNLCILQVSPLVPFPGTDLYDRLRNEGRELDKDWSKYDLYHVPFTPKNMSKKELIEGMEYVRKNYYSWPSIMKRVIYNSRKLGMFSTMFNLFLNWSYKDNQKKGFHYPP
jgi:radical SAM superfamily enzyme YgiQ (UPF0313 family)